LEVNAAARGFLAETTHVDSLKEKLKSLGYTLDVSMDMEHGEYKITYREGSQTPRTVGHQLLSGGEYQRLTSLHKSMTDTDRPPFVVRAEGKDETKLSSRQALIDHLMEVGKKDLQPALSLCGDTRCGRLG